MNKRSAFWTTVSARILFAILATAFAASAEDTEPLNIALPKPQTKGTPRDIPMKNVEPFNPAPRAPFMAPKGLANVAEAKPVTASDSQPIIGELEMATDGDKEAGDGSFIEFGPGLQWIQVDLRAPHEIYAVLLWHYHSEFRVYRDVILQLSDDPDFVKDVKTLYNNDSDNSAKLGVGPDKEYIESNQGRLIDCKGTKARYLRAYTNGNTSNDMNHFIELEAFARPAK